MIIEKVDTNFAPKAIGPYSQATVVNNIIYTSGQIAIDPKTQIFLDGTIEEQTKLVINNIKSILNSKNISFENVFKVTIFLKNMSDFTKVNDIYSKYFISKPARSTVEVSRLPKDALIEIECIATVN